MWHTIVIGSGIAGLTAAAALARKKHRVLVLEQHRVPGGLTQSFRRGAWSFSPGVHYIGGVGPHEGPGGQFGRLLTWLAGEPLPFASCGNPYDRVNLPGFEFGISYPETSFQAALLARFPDERAAIDAWFAQLDAARRAAYTMFALRGMPSWLAWGMKLWRGAEIEHWTRRTLAQALDGVAHPQLRAVLGARWGDYGAPPDTAPFIEHALVTGSYNHGAYFPIGGPGRFAQALIPVIAAAGGELRLGADVTHIQVDGGRATGVTVHRGDGRTHEEADHVISAMGVSNTLERLDADVARPWQAAMRQLKPGPSYLALFLGFEGDIAAAGASAANHWIYESADIGRLLRSPADEDAPSLFVSFPSLKDPSATAPTGEVVALCDGEAFAPWLHHPDGRRAEDYLAFKGWVEDRLLSQFKRHFPALAPMLRFHEMSTPLTQRHFVRAAEGSMYGLEMSAERLAHPGLRVRTPVPGLLLAGQDVGSPGVQGAFMSGLMAAAALEPALFRQLGS
jgi:all-trans-retinol 13,14-reductase